jgi:hypothetical protein
MTYSWWTNGTNTWWLIVWWWDDAQDNKIGILQFIWTVICSNKTTWLLATISLNQWSILSQTHWGDDGGGKQVVQQRKGTRKEPPANPGDTKGCSDFEYYEDALRWFKTYQPYHYGDVARLDPDRDGVPCPGLGHTPDHSRYRIKVPLRWNAFHLSSTLTPGPEHLIAKQ